MYYISGTLRQQGFGRNFGDFFGGLWYPAKMRAQSEIPGDSGVVSRDPGRYRHHRHYSVRFGDLDLYRHVNNKAYLGWIEDARVRYLLDAGQFSAGMEESRR